MAVLEKIRVKFGIFISVIIALALLSFIIDPQTLQNVAALTSSKYNVGEINGEKISYQDFSKRVEEQTAINQTLFGRTIQDENAQEQVRQDVWQQYINQNLFFKNCKKAGIELGESEKVALTSVSDYTSPVILSFFGDPQTGTVSREVLNGFKAQVAQDESGSLKACWRYIKDLAYAQQMYAKYASVFAYSQIVNPLALAKNIEENNVSCDVDFVVVPVSFAPDSTITVTEKEKKAYYAAHKDEFKQDEMRDIEYVVIEVKASEQDVLDAQKAFNKALDSFTTATNFKTFLLQNSDRTFDQTYYAKGELTSVLSSEINEFVFSDKSKNGAVAQFSDSKAFYAVKVVDTKKEDGVEKKQVAVLEKDIVPSNVTTNDFYAKANTIAVKAKGTLEGLRAAAKEEGVYVQSFPRMGHGSANLGAVAHTKEVTRWAFEQKRPGKLSDIFTIDNKYFILAAVSGTHKEGFASFESQASSIEFELTAQKKADKAVAEVAAKIAGLSTLEEVASTLGLTVNHRDNITFSTPNYAQALDPAVTGAAVVAEVGKVSAPIKGTTGTFVIRVTDKETGYFFTEDDAKRANERLASQMANTVLGVMVQEGKVVNHLNRFF